jgi:hypothetical protein
MRSSAPNPVNFVPGTPTCDHTHFWIGQDLKFEYKQLSKLPTHQLHPLFDYLSFFGFSSTATTPIW